jgi:hypothetical protein
MSHPFVSDLDTPLLKLGPNTYFTTRDAVAGVHVLGATGSGKSSGPGKALSAAYLRAGFGALVHISKPEDIALWVNYAKENGREDSVILFDETRGYNFIEAELSRHGIRGLSTVVEYLMQVLAAADQAMGAAGKESDDFWRQATQKCLNYCLPLLYSAWGKVSVRSIVDFVTQAATDGKRYLESGFAESNFAGKTLCAARDSPRIPLPEAERDAFMRFWVAEYPAMAEKTRSNIVTTLSAKLDRFLHGRLAEAFCSKTDICPEMMFGGGIIIMCMPIQTWNEDGNTAQKLFKSAAMRAILARNSLEPTQRARPVAIWADEAQNVVTDADHAFLSVCRASRACVVYLTQSLPTYYAQLGPGKQDSAEALIGKFGTQVFCANACPKTNKYASELIGRAIHRRATEGRSVGSNTSRGLNSGQNANRGSSSGDGTSYGQAPSFNHNSGTNTGSGENWGSNLGRGTNEGANWGTSEQMDFLVEPRCFASDLKTGGPMNRNLVTAYWVKAGAQFKDGDGGNYLITSFRQ